MVARETVDIAEIRRAQMAEELERQREAARRAQELHEQQLRDIGYER